MPLVPIGAKSATTLAEDALAGLHRWHAMAGQTGGPAALVYGGGERAKRSAAVVYSGQCCKHRCKHRDIVGLAPAQVQQKQVQQK